MNEKKRILILSLAWHPVESGGEIAPRKIAEGLNAEYEFDVLCYRFSSLHQPFEQASYGRIYRIGGFGHGYFRKNLWTLKAGYRALMLHRTQKYDAVWVIMAAYGAGAAYIFSLFSPRVPIVLTLQEGDPFEHIYRRLGVLRPFWHMFFRRVTAVQAISRYLADFAKQCGFRAEPRVIPNGVRVPETLESQHSNIQEKNPIVLISNSRLEKKNGLDIVIRALPLLPKHIIFKNVHHGSERDSLRALAQELGVGDRVTLDEPLPYEQAVAYLKEGDIFVRPSRSEGLGASFLEAMALGIPIIGTPVGGIPDFLHDGETGLFAEPESPESLAAAVRRLVEDPALYSAVRKNAYELMKKSYSWDFVIHKMRALFTSVHA